MSKHTPGPWEVEIIAGDPGLPISQGGGEKVFVGTKELRLIHVKRVSARKYGEAVDIPLATTKANAALIAAAPDLLKVCQDIRDWFEGEGFQYSEELEKAITKAEASNV